MGRPNLAVSVLRSSHQSVRRGCANFAVGTLMRIRDSSSVPRLSSDGPSIPCPVILNLDIAPQAVQHLPEPGDSRSCLGISGDAGPAVKPVERGLEILDYIPQAGREIYNGTLLLPGWVREISVDPRLQIVDVAPDRHRPIFCRVDGPWARQIRAPHLQAEILLQLVQLKDSSSFL